MNAKKFLQILEILFPFLQKAEKEDGNINYNHPLGNALYVSPYVRVLYKAIWFSDSGVLSFAERCFRFLINLIFSIVAAPIAIIIWCISQLIFSINFDKKERSKGRKTHLFLAYSCVAVLIITLGVMIVDYNADGKITNRINTNINESIDKINQNEDRKATRSETVRINKLQSIEEVHEEHEVTTAIVTTQVKEDDGYILKRKSR